MYFRGDCRRHSEKGWDWEENEAGTMWADKHIVTVINGGLLPLGTSRRLSYLPFEISLGHFNEAKSKWKSGGKDSNCRTVCVCVSQPCLTLCNSTDCSPPGSYVHGILQARILELVAISFSRASCWPRDQTQVSCIAGIFFTTWAAREVIINCRHRQEWWFPRTEGKAPWPSIIRL